MTDDEKDVYDICSQQGVPYLAVELRVEYGYRNLPTVRRPARALNPQEAMAMIKVWKYVYRGLNATGRNGEPYDYDNEEHTAHWLDLLSRPLGLALDEYIIDKMEKMGPYLR